MKKNLKTFSERLIKLYIYTKIYLHEKENIRKKKKLYTKVNLSKEQENEIQTMFSSYYGKRYSTKWHRLYQSYTGRYDKNYFPEILYTTKLEPILNPRRYTDVLADKRIDRIIIS